MSTDEVENNLDSLSCHDLLHDEAAFETFVKKHYKHLCVYCRFKFGFEIEMAEDIVSTSFIKLWEVRQTLTDDLSPKSYLYRIIYNTSLNTLKHEKVRQQYAREVLKTTSETVQQSNFDGVDLKQLRADIYAAIAELPPQMRRVFELSKFEGLKYGDIAVELNISKKTVKTQMSRALLKLREKLAQYYLNGLIFLILAYL